MELYEKGKDWSKVGYLNKTGYVSNEYLKEISGSNNDKEESIPVLKPISSVKVVGSDIWIRKEANWSSDKLISVKKGSVMELYEKGKDWSKVGYSNKTGYVSNEYLKHLDELDSNEPGDNQEGEDLETLKGVSNVNTRYAVKNNVGVYSDSKLTSFKGYLNKGSKIEKIEDIGATVSKYKISEGEYGYIKNENISHRNPLAVNKEVFTERKIDKTHLEYLNSQANKTYPTKADIKKYSNTENMSMSNGNEKYQFLKLNKFREVNVYELNEYINKNTIKPGYNPIFKDKAQVFVDAARKHNIDVVYLVAHSLLESGYGTSKLSQGVEVDGIKVYNLYGIGAVDSDAIGGGSRTAAYLGWTTIDKAIEGAAKWISTGVAANPSIGLKESWGYINSQRFDYQYTLYSMRWDWKNGWHQYASDSRWAYKIADLMNRIAYVYEGAELVFEKICYKQPTGTGKEEEKAISEVVSDEVESSECIDDSVADEDNSIDMDVNNELMIASDDKADDQLDMGFESGEVEVV